MFTADYKRKLLALISIYIGIVVLFILASLFIFRGVIHGLVLSIAICIILFFVKDKKRMDDIKKEDDKWKQQCMAPCDDELKYEEDETVRRCFNGNKKQYEEYCNQSNDDDDL